MADQDSARDTMPDRTGPIPQSTVHRSVKREKEDSVGGLRAPGVHLVEKREILASPAIRIPGPPTNRTVRIRMMCRLAKEPARPRANKPIGPPPSCPGFSKHGLTASARRRCPDRRRSPSDMRSPPRSNALPPFEHGRIEPRSEGSGADAAKPGGNSRLHAPIAPGRAPDQRE